MAAEAAVPLWGWVRRIATMSRRIVVATFLIYNIDAMSVPIACFARRARRLLGLLPDLSIVPLAPIRMVPVPVVRSFSQPLHRKVFLARPSGSPLA